MSSGRATAMRVLYVPTTLPGYVRYFSEGSTSDTEYFHLLQRMLRRLAKHPHVEVLYKPFPSNWVEDPIPEFLAAQVPNARVVTGSLVELIHEVDAVVVDFPSTVLAEVVMTAKPLAVHGGEGWCPLFDDAVALLRRRALVSSTPEEFEANVELLVTRPEEARRLDDTEFRRRHVTFQDDGRSADRVAARIAAAV